ncbi:hypothetical protein [Bacillus nakamurai]|nr:hypothetical protein [Bacillus nakamurai]
MKFLGYFRHKADSEDSFRLMIEDFIVSVSKK